MPTKDQLREALAGLLALEDERRKAQGLRDCTCVNWSHATERAYEAGRCPHQVARAAIATPDTLPPGQCKYGDPRCPCQDGDSCHYEDTADTRATVPPVAVGDVVVREVTDKVQKIDEHGWFYVFDGAVWLESADICRIERDGVILWQRGKD